MTHMQNDCALQQEQKLKKKAKHPNDWTEAEEQILREGWERGLSGSRIGELVKKTRCSVLGKARRLNLPMRGASSGHGTNTARQRKPSAPRVPKGPRAPMEATPMRKLTPRGKPVAPKHYPDPVPITDKPPIGIMELSRNTCRAIVGHGSDGLAVYCGDDVFAGKSFCEGHCAMYYEYRKSA